MFRKTLTGLFSLRLHDLLSTRTFFLDLSVVYNANALSRHLASVCEIPKLRKLLQSIHGICLDTDVVLSDNVQHAPCLVWGADERALHTYVPEDELLEGDFDFLGLASRVISGVSQKSAVNSPAQSAPPIHASLSSHMQLQPRFSHR